QGAERMKKLGIGSLAAVPRWKGVWMAALSLTALAGLWGGLLVFGGNGAKEHKRHKGSSVERVEANGKTEGAQREVPMRPEIPGKLTILHVRESQDVAAGTVLAELDNEIQKQQLNLAKTQLDVAEVVLQQAELELKRESRIFKGHASAEASYEDKLFKKLTAEARCKEARAQVLLSQAHLAQTQLTARSNGRVLKINAEPGEQVGPAMSEPLL